MQRLQESALTALNAMLDAGKFASDVPVQPRLVPAWPAPTGACRRGMETLRAMVDCSAAEIPEALSGASSSIPHQWGRGRAAAVRSLRGPLLGMLWSRDNDDRRFAVWERQASGIRFFSSAQAAGRAAMFCATCVPRLCRSSPAYEARIALRPNRRRHLPKSFLPTWSNQTRLLR
jgi:hypothetical protein